MRTKERETGNLADVREFLEIGWSFENVQQLFGKSRNELLADIAEMGYGSYNEFKEQNIYQDYKKGMSVGFIAIKWQRKPKTIANIIRKMKKMEE